jgi:fluoride exporter
LAAEFAGKILSVGAGGALGAVARYLINISPLSTVMPPFPFPTFFINVTGSFLIGCLLILFTDKLTINENLQAAVVVGFLGAYTTFSTFELEIFSLMKEGRFPLAFLYLFFSVFLGFVGVAGGVWLARKF